MSTRGEDLVYHDELELEQVRNFRKVINDITKYVKGINLRDFIPFFKWD